MDGPFLAVTMTQFTKYIDSDPLLVITRIIHVIKMTVLHPLLLRSTGHISDDNSKWSKISIRTPLLIKADKHTIKKSTNV